MRVEEGTPYQGWWEFGQVELMESFPPEEAETCPEKVLE